VLGALLSGLSLVLLAATLASFAYLIAAVVCTCVFARRRDPVEAGPPVTILKPLRGDEPGLYENLRSFCEQDYPAFQVVFGVRDATDPAVPVVERILRDLPGRDLALVVNDRVIGSNLKVSNLANMVEAAKHDLLVIADSDIRVGRTYLGTVVPPLADPRVGVVTCLYTGRAQPGLWPALGAVFINEWFLPSALVAHALRSGRFCFGATMAVRREALDAIGGFPVLAAYLADDYVLGVLMNARGRRVALSAYVVENTVQESSLRALWSHELRWARTMRTAEPAGYAMSFLTYSVVLSCFHLLVSSSGALGTALVVGAVAIRLAVHYAVRWSLGITEPSRPWLIPVRDWLCVAVWAASFSGRTVRWRESHFSVARDGRMRANGRDGR
jgi:ceramide glucosyltransferase